MRIAVQKNSVSGEINTNISTIMCYAINSDVSLTKQILLVNSCYTTDRWLVNDWDNVDK